MFLLTTFIPDCQQRPRSAAACGLPLLIYNKFPLPYFVCRFYPSSSKNHGFPYTSPHFSISFTLCRYTPTPRSLPASTVVLSRPAASSRSAACSIYWVRSRSIRTACFLIAHLFLLQEPASNTLSESRSGFWELVGTIWYGGKCSIILSGENSASSRRRSLPSDLPPTDDSS